MKRKICGFVLLAFMLTAIPPLISGLPYGKFNPQGNVLVLLYHTFTSQDIITAGQYTLFTTAEKFEDDINILLESGLKPISLEKFYRNDYDGKLRYFAIAFDDGYLTNYTVAYPIIKEYGLYADIFVNTDNFYLSHHFSLAQADEMEKSGRVKIYSHLPQHEQATKYTSEKLAGEINRSFGLLNSGLSKKRLRFIAYPEGDYNPDTFGTAKNCGVLLQMIQIPYFENKELVIRTSVSYDTDMRKLIETAVYN